MHNDDDNHIPPAPASKKGAVGLSSERCSAAGGSGGAGLPDEEGEADEDDEEDILPRVLAVIPPVAAYVQ